MKSGQFRGLVTALFCMGAVVGAIEGAVLVWLAPRAQFPKNRPQP